MKLGLHTGTIMYTNVVTDIRIARDAGYDAIEIQIPKLVRYLDAGYRPEDLSAALGPLQVAMLNSFLHIERQESDFRQELRHQCARLCAAAETLGCTRLQVIPLSALRGLGWPEMRALVGQSLAELADIAAPFGVELVLEPVTFTPLRTLTDALDVLGVAGRDNIRLCIDTFHLWTGGTSWDQVAALDPALMGAVHISDVTPRRGEEWSDDDRDVLPGDGVLPLRPAIDAIRATGYDGVWSVEMLGPRHWEWDPARLAAELRGRVTAMLAG